MLLKVGVKGCNEEGTRVAVDKIKVRDLDCFFLRNMLRNHLRKKMGVIVGGRVVDGAVSVGNGGSVCVWTYVVFTSLRVTGACFKSST